MLVILALRQRFGYLLKALYLHKNGTAEPIARAVWMMPMAIPVVNNVFCTGVEEWNDLVFCHVI
jgi:ABC-type sugar transport system permease subunit